MPGSLVIANYITVTTDSETSIHRGKGHNLLFVQLSQVDHNKMPILLTEKVMLMTARILYRSVTAQLPVGL